MNNETRLYKDRIIANASGRARLLRPVSRWLITGIWDLIIVNGPVHRHR